MKDSMIHPEFKIKGRPISRKDLSELAYSFIKEGEPYQVSIGSFLLDWLSPKNSIVVNTSGSTGTPKSISLLKEHMKNSALATGAYFNLTPGTTCLHCLPCEYIAGKMMLVRALVLGLDIHFVEPSSAPLKSIDNQKSFDFCAMVPLQVQSSFDEIDRLKKLIIGGTPVSKEVKKKLFPKKTKCFETYGMTETITHVAIKEITSEFEQPPFKALPNVFFSCDKRGCLVIEAPLVVMEKVVTNDIVDLVSDQEFHWLGRYDNVINSAGVKLFPETIENKLMPPVESPFIIAGIDDERPGQKLILIRNLIPHKNLIWPV
ncbi:AMP-binding protein [Maribacter litopenaei]|uniref:AMP-binding protein n=1 Tax=Maribacter litopenaei TaxID=2976127 RepID=A0ABY5YBQ2_9FLAO|nr:AMP-binding protein [Maribacter litopenaei]UWX56139.1 AMP-binding protein [Maribacter litopenaei]